MVHWWVQVHFGRILPHTSFSVFFFIFWMLKFWQNFIEYFTNLAKIALEKKILKTPQFLSQNMAKLCLETNLIIFSKVNLEIMS